MQPNTLPRGGYKVKFMLQLLEKLLQHSSPDMRKIISDTEHKKKRCSPILKLARGVEPGWVEIMPRKRVTLQVRTWLYSEQTDTRYFSDSVTFVTGDLQSTQGSDSTSGCTPSR